MFFFISRNVKMREVGDGCHIKQVVLVNLYDFIRKILSAKRWNFKKDTYKSAEKSCFVGIYAVCTTHFPIFSVEHPINYCY